MNIDLLIKMTNEISQFFASEDEDPEQAARDVASHLKRYWDPRMRTQIITYYEQRQSMGQNGGLGDLAWNAIGLLAAENKAKAAAPDPHPPRL